MSLLRVFKRLFSNNPATADVQREVIEQAIAPVIERLEERQLLSTTPTYPSIIVKGTNNAAITYQESSPITADGTDFGSLDTKASKIETFTIGNSGPGVLNLTAFSRVQVTGANAADFVVTAQPAASVLANGLTTFKLKFSPTTAAAEHATVTIYNDTDSKDPFTFDVQGTGTQTPKAQVTGNTKVLSANDTTIQLTDNTQFGSVESVAGTVTKTFTLKNLGSGTLHLSGSPLAVVTGDTGVFSVVTQPPSSIAAGASADFTVKFLPSGATGVKNAVITLTTDDTTATSYHFAVQGTAVAQPVMNVVGRNSTALTAGATTTNAVDGTDFGSIDIASGTVTRTFTIQNAGGSALSLSGTPIIDIQGTNKTAFAIVTQPANTVAAQSSGTPGSVTFQVRFTPGTVGAKTAQIVIANNAPGVGGPFKFNISGTAISQAKLDVLGGTSPTDVIGDGTNVAATGDGTDFGTVDKTGGSATHTFTIKDLGSAALHLSGSPKVSVVETGGGTDFTVTTQPAIATLAGASPAGGRVGATPVKPAVATGPGPTNKHGHHQSHGKRIHKVSVVAPPVVPNSTTFAIKFAPTDDTTAAKAAVVTIASDDPNVPAYTFNIAGTATSASLAGVTGGTGNVTIANGDTTATVAKGTDFGSIDTTQTVTQTFTVTNTGTNDLTFTGGAVLSNTTDFAIPSGQDIAGPIPTGTTATFQVAFHPAATGNKTSTVTLATNDPNAASYVFTVKGVAAASPVTAVTSSVSSSDVDVLAGTTTTSVSNNTDFGNAELNAGLVTQTFKIANSGSTALNIAHITLTGTNRTDFAFVGSLPTTVAAGANATFQVKFRPTVAGVRVATVTVQSNDAGTPNYAFAIKGTAVRQPVINLFGAAHAITTGNTAATLDGTDFGNADPAGPVTRTFTIRNTGSDALNLSSLAITGTDGADFAIVNRPRTSIAAGGSATFDVKFTPSTTGAEVGIITLNSDDATNPAFVLNVGGTGIAASLLTVKGGSSQATTVPVGETTPRALDGTDFGQAVVNRSSSSNTFTITNTGSAALNLSTMTITGASGSGDFSITQQPTSPVTATNGTTTFVVKFAPTAAGVRTAVITIPSDDPKTPYTFTVRGVGVVAPIIAVQGAGSPILDGSAIGDVDTSNNTDFGNVEQATGTATLSYSILNTGSAALTLTGTKKVDISGANAADFTVVTQPDSSIAAGGNKTFQIKFAPKGSGVRTATVTIASNDASNSSYTFVITGTAVQMPVLTVSGNSHGLVNGQNATTSDGSDMGSAKVGLTVSKTFTIKNTGSATLNLTGSDLVSINGTYASDFLVTQPLVTSLAAGASTTFSVVFTPSVIGAESAVASIDSDDPNGSFSFNLAGTGTTP